MRRDPPTPPLPSRLSERERERSRSVDRLASHVRRIQTENRGGKSYKQIFRSVCLQYLQRAEAALRDARHFADKHVPEDSAKAAADLREAPRDY